MSEQKTVLPLTSMDAGLLRQIAAKVDDDVIDVNDAKVLRGIAESVDSVLEWCEGARSKEEVEEILFGNAEQPNSRPTDANVHAQIAEAKGIWEKHKHLVREDLWPDFGDGYVNGYAAALQHERSKQADGLTEITNEMVERAVKAWRDEYGQEYPGSGNWPAMRAALEAALNG